MISTWAEECPPEHSHWLHEREDGDVTLLQSRMARWLRNHDGAHVLLADRTEIGNTFIPDRGQSEAAGRGGEYMPEHVHHNYRNTDVYEQSR